MSVPASPIGHGALGLRGNLRGFEDLTEQSFCEHRAYVELHLGKQIISTWNASGDAWTTSVTETFDGLSLELATVTTSAGDTLTRVERITDCQSTEGTFYYVSATGVLYVHLTDDVDPNSLVMLAVFLKRFGSVGAVEPVMGPEKLTDGSLEAWTNDNTPTNWSKVNAGAGSVRIGRDHTLFYDGVFSVKLMASSIGLADATQTAIQQGSHIGVSGADYIVSGAYRTSLDLPVGAEARVRVSDGTNFMLSDGRNPTTSDTGVSLPPTGGEWRRFLFAFRCLLDTTSMQIRVLLYNGTGATITAGQVNFDDVKLRRVHRYEFVEPRLARESLGALEFGNTDIFFGAEAVALGGLRLLNSDDAYLETLLEVYDVIGRSVYVRLGGSFDDGQEIPFDDTWPALAAFVHSFSVDDAAAIFQVEDARSLLATVLPTRSYGGDFQDLAEADQGRPRPLLFGSKTNIRPAAFEDAFTIGTDYRTYEVADCTDSPAGLYAFNEIWSYTSEEAAAAQDPNERFGIVANALLGTHVIPLTSIGQFYVIKDVKLFRIEAGVNDRLDFDIGAGALVASLTPGLYVPETLRAHVASRLAIAVGGGSSWSGSTYSETTHKYTFNHGTPGPTNWTIRLSATTAVSRDRSAWPMLGYTGDTDLAGSPSYTSDTAVFADADTEHIVRVDAQGYKDDASGTYTGTASALIEKGPDILRYLLRRVLKRPTTEIDDASFVAGRTSTGQALAVYLGGLAAITGGEGFTLTLQEVIDRLENGAHTDIVMDGSGKWYWRPRPKSASDLTAAAASAPIFYDRDFLSFQSSKSAEDVYQVVRVTYAQDPSTGQVRTREANNVAVEVRHARSAARQFDTFLSDDDDAQAQAWNLMLLAVLPRRHVDFTLQGRVTKKLVGELVKIQRTRMLGEEIPGMLNADVFRILSMRVDPQTHLCTVSAYTADLPRVADAEAYGVMTVGLYPPALLWYTPSKPQIKSDRAGLR